MPEPTGPGCSKGRQWVAGRDARRAAALAAELGAQRVRGIGLDAADAPSVRRALEGVDLLVIAAVVPRHVAVLARTAISAGTDWLDFQIHRGQARVLDGMADEIAAAGRCFVTQAGFHPGVPAALVRWAALRVDELRGAWISSVLAERGRMPATSGLDELVASFRDYRAMRYEHGRWRQLAGTRPSDYPVVDFGFGFGRRRTFVMEFDELYPCRTACLSCGTWASRSPWTSPQTSRRAGSCLRSRSPASDHERSACTAACWRGRTAASRARRMAASSNWTPRVSATASRPRSRCACATRTATTSPRSPESRWPSSSWKAARGVRVCIAWA